jgi:hypothetical protein
MTQISGEFSVGMTGRVEGHRHFYDFEFTLPAA